MADWAGACAAIEQRLSANWSTTPIGLENGAEPAMQDGSGLLTPWAFCEIESDDANIRGIGKPGSHVVVEDGAIVITVFVPLGTDRSTARTYAGQIGEIFRVKEFYNSEPGCCVRTWTPRVGRGEETVSENPKGKWWAVPVTIPFEFIHLA